MLLSICYEIIESSLRLSELELCFFTRHSTSVTVRVELENRSAVGRLEILIADAGTDVEHSVELP